jgi:hypothetical protein
MRRPWTREHQALIWHYDPDGSGRMMCGLVIPGAPLVLGALGTEERSICPTCAVGSVRAGVDEVLHHDLERAAEAMASLIDLFGPAVLRRALRLVVDRRKAREGRT